MDLRLDEIIIYHDYAGVQVCSKPLLNVVRFEPFNSGIEKGSTQPRAVSDRLLMTPDFTRFWDLRNAKEESVKGTCVSEHLLAEVFFYLFAKQVATII